MLKSTIFYTSLGYNIVLEKLALRQWYSHIDNAVILGALPFKSMTKKLVDKEDVKGVVTLNEPYETRNLCNTTEEWAKAGVEHLVLPTQDFVAAPTQEQLKQGVAFLLNRRLLGGKTYVHCKAGRTRSTTLVACYLMSLHVWTPIEAVDFIQKKRPQILLRNSQWTALGRYYNENVSTVDSSRV